VSAEQGTGTWLLILGELLCWGVYSTYELDPRLMVLSWTGVAASLLILTRVAAQARLFASRSSLVSHRFAMILSCSAL
jgi:hypothetical protein